MDRQRYRATRAAPNRALRLHAVEHIRRMRGGTQSQLMRCSDGGYYIVKSPNNPQGQTILANELLGARLAEVLGLPVAESEVVMVSEDLIRASDMHIELGRGRMPCQPGPCFGSRFPGDPDRFLAFDFLTGTKLVNVKNFSDFLGMLVFDKWTSNLDGRQTVFFRENADTPYQARMIDQGFCFGGTDWIFSDGPRYGPYCYTDVYQGVTGLANFEPWLEKLDSQITECVLAAAADEIPPGWYGDNRERLNTVLERLYLRRRRVPELLSSLRTASPDTFPNWGTPAFYCSRH